MADAWVQAAAMIIAEQISASSFQKMKKPPSSIYATTVTQAVITVPLISTPPSARRPRTLAREPALEVLRIINEPTAAALATA